MRAGFAYSWQAKPLIHHLYYNLEVYIMSKVVVMEHPLIQHKIGIMRREDTSTKEFRALASEVAMLICYEATRNLPLADIKIKTPLVETTTKEIAGKKLCIVPILRAGLHMADGILNLIPNAKVGGSYVSNWLFFYLRYQSVNSMMNDKNHFSLFNCRS